MKTLEAVDKLIGPWYKILFVLYVLKGILEYIINFIKNGGLNMIHITGLSTFFIENVVGLFFVLILIYGWYKIAERSYHIKPLVKSIIVCKNQGFMNIEWAKAFQIILDNIQTLPNPQKIFRGDCKKIIQLATELDRKPWQIGVYYDNMETGEVNINVFQRKSVELLGLLNRQLSVFYKKESSQ
jgi:hypothetical protein